MYYHYQPGSNIFYRILQTHHARARAHTHARTRVRTHVHTHPPPPSPSAAQAIAIRWRPTNSDGSLRLRQFRSLAIQINTRTGDPIQPRFWKYFAYKKKLLGRTETRTRDRIFCQTMRTVRDISRDDRARIATCSLRTLTDIRWVKYLYRILQTHHARTRAHTHARTRVRTHVRTHMHTGAHKCTHVHTRAHTCTYVHTRAHTQPSPPSPSAAQAIDIRWRPTNRDGPLRLRQFRSLAIQINIRTGDPTHPRFWKFFAYKKCIARPN